MSPNSSISSSRPARLLAVILGLPLLLLAAIAAIQIWALALGVDAHGYGRIINHQTAKLEGYSSGGTLFIGDSSLGNAISATVWEEAGGGPARNLALVGYFGYSGGLEMARRALAAGRPDRIVFTYNMMLPQQPERFERLGSLLTAGSPVSGGALSPASARAAGEAFLNWKILRRNLRGIVNHYRGRADRTGPPLADDFIRQDGPADVAGRRAHAAGSDYRPLALSPASLEVLQQMGALCQAAAVDCLFLHGPVFEAYCENAAGYFDYLNARIKAAGLTLAAPRPICFPAEDMGDTENHVRPDLKAGYTRRYLELLGPAG